MIFLLGMVLNFNMAMAENISDCTVWEKQAGVSCIFAGEESKSWKRDCSAALEEHKCKRGPGKLPPSKPCLAETMCFDFNPEELGVPCSRWTKEYGVTCGIDSKPRVWRRACQWEVLPTTACTKSRKSYPTEEDFID